MNIIKFEETFEGSNGYLIVKNNKAVLIDAAENNQLIKYLNDNNIKIQIIILTHEHIDHISGLNDLRKEYCVKVISSEACNCSIQNPISNMARYFETFLYFKKNYNLVDSYNKDNKKYINYSCSCTDISFNGKYKFEWDNHIFELIETPGHSKGSISIVIDNKYLFSGDSLLKDMEVITKFPGGSTKIYNIITLPFYKSLDRDIIVYPGHGQGFILKEII